MVKWTLEVPGALLTGSLSQRLEEGWERFTVGKTGETEDCHFELIPQYSSNNLQKLRPASENLESSDLIPNSFFS